MLGQRRLQERHLVGQDAPIAEDEALVAADRIRNIQQRHPCLFGPAVALARIARPTGGYYVGPFMPSAARHGHDMLDGQMQLVEPVPAVATHVAIARKQPMFGQTNMGMADREAMATADHHDRARQKLGTQSRAFLISTAHREKVLSQVGDDLARGVIASGPSQGCPADRLSMGVDDQDTKGAFDPSHLESLTRIRPLWYAGGVQDACSGLPLWPGLEQRG
jgi:hypothetical protein